MIFLPELDQLGLSDADWEGLCVMAEARQVDNERLLEVQANAALMGRWDVVYAFSYLAGLETSVLIDAEDSVSIDWGSPGRVALSPPVGCAAPFKVWTHTHPGFDAYWSGTDTNSLANGASIVSRALVLGAPGIKRALNQSLSTEPIPEQRIMKSGPLHLWSNEPITPWTAFYEQLDTTAKYEVKA